jgi:two-component system sensor histidine kinase HydH
MVGPNRITYDVLSLVALLLAWLAYSVISTGSVSFLIGISENRSAIQVWRSNYFNEFMISLLSAPLALVMAKSYMDSGAFPVLVLLVPLIAINFMIRFLVERARIQARAERERHLADLGKVSATILHELAKPLTRILMISDDALQGGAPARDALEQVMTEASQTRSLSEKLTRAMRLQVQRNASDPFTIVRLLKERTDSESIPVLVEFEEGVERTDGSWDNDLIVTALLNLARNAWESQQSRGEPVEVFVNAVTSRVPVTGQETVSIRFVVRDRGLGLPSDVGPDIFTALYSTKDAGFGMGLFLANQIVLAHGGRLTATGHQEGGAEFALELPLSRA